MNYPKKPGFNLNQSRHCAYTTYSVKTWLLKILSVYARKGKMSFITKKSVCLVESRGVPFCGGTRGVRSRLPKPSRPGQMSGCPTDFCVTRTSQKMLI